MTKFSPQHDNAHIHRPLFCGTLKKNSMEKNIKQTGIWIDGSKAIIVDLVKGQETIREIPSGIENNVHHNHEGKKGTFMGSHHLNNERKFEERKRHETHKFLDKVVHEVGQSDALYIMGPSEMKHALKDKIEKDKMLREKIKGMQAADYITLNQTVAEVKKYFNELEYK
jgi:hypothetical protein